MSTMGERIKALREAKGWSFFELSMATRIQEQNLRKWEKGTGISDPDNIAALADALGTTTDFLIKGTAPLEAAV